MGARWKNHLKACGFLRHRSSFAGPTGRRGILRAAAGFRWAVLGILCCAKLPMALAAMAALFQLSGEHEVQVGFSTNRLEITLHHRQAATRHTHSLWESVLIGKPASGQEPDHHMQFVRGPMASEQEELDGLDEAFGIIPTAISRFATASFLTCKTLHLPDHVVDSTPPLALRRGVVMRV